MQANNLFVQDMNGIGFFHFTDSPIDACMHDIWPKSVTLDTNNNWFYANTWFEWTTHTAWGYRFRFSSNWLLLFVVVFSGWFLLMINMMVQIVNQLKLVFKVNESSLVLLLACMLFLQLIRFRYLWMICFSLSRRHPRPFIILLSFWKIWQKKKKTHIFFFRNMCVWVVPRPCCMWAFSLRIDPLAYSVHTANLAHSAYWSAF